MSSLTEQREAEFDAILRAQCLERVRALMAGDVYGWLDEAAKWAVIAEALRPQVSKIEILEPDVNAKQPPSE